MRNAITGLGVLGLLVGSSAVVPAVAAATPTALTRTEYGHSVAISGSTAAVGAPGVNHGAGAVYIFGRTRAGWRFQTKINDPAHIAQDAFGWSVAVLSTRSRTYLAVGETSINGATNFVYVFTRSARNWHLRAAVEDPQNYSGSNFGYSVALSQSTLAIGTPGANNQYGVVYMYSPSGSGWTLSRTLVDPGTNFGDNFGYSVAVSGATAVVTASDVAYVYIAGLGRPWTRSAILKNPAGVTEDFGWDASLAGNTAVIGAPPAHAGSGQGAAYVFVRSRSKWRIQARLASPGFVTNDKFGYAVAISGSRILVGAEWRQA